MLELVNMEVIIYCPISKMYQSSIICPRSDLTAQLLFHPQISAAEGVQVHSDLLPGAHHANGGVEASYW